ncbi:hypothetical protein QJQ45_015205, partial [Haematococcus lacustris]
CWQCGALQQPGGYQPQPQPQFSERMVAGSQKRTLVTETKRYYDSSEEEIWRQYFENFTPCREARGPVALSLFGELKPRWVKKLTEAQRQVCVCRTCCNINFLLKALAKHKSLLQLPSLVDPPEPHPQPHPQPQPQPQPQLQHQPLIDDGDEDIHSPFSDPNHEFEHGAAAFSHQTTTSQIPTLSASVVRAMCMCPCDAGAHHIECMRRSCSMCKSKHLHLKPGEDGSTMLLVKQYAPKQQEKGPQKVELVYLEHNVHEALALLNQQLPEYIWHHHIAHHQLATFTAHQTAVHSSHPGMVVISCDWSERFTVQRPQEIQSEHWCPHTVGILVACVYFKTASDAYREETVYVLTDGNDQSAPVTQAALYQVIAHLKHNAGMDLQELFMWSDGCAGQFKGTPALQQHRRMALNLSVPLWWSYGATSHFKGRHDSEGGVLKHKLRDMVLADHDGLATCRAQQLTAAFNNKHTEPASQVGACKAHRDRAKVMRRECLVLDKGLVKECYKQDEDADSFKGTVQGSRAQHSMYFPANTEGELMWSMTACACGARMSNPPQPCGAQCRGSMPLEPMPMLLDKEAARQAALNAECIRLMRLDTPDMPQFDTLNKDLLKAWCKHNNIRGVSSKSKNELRDMCLLKLRKKVEAPRHM